MRNVQEYTIMDRVGTLTAVFTVANATDICTSNAHGLKNGDAVVLTSDGTLALGLSTGTVYYVIEVTTNTFKLSLTPCPTYTTGTVSPPVPVVDITADCTDNDTFTMHDIGRNIPCADFRHAIFSFHGASSANMTVKFQGSIGDGPTTPFTCPDFSAAQAYNNAWDYIEVIDLEDGSAIDGDTGVAQAGTNDHRTFEANINGLSWLNCIITAWSAGTTTIRVKLFNN